MVEHPLGKGEVECSIHSGSTIAFSGFMHRRAVNHLCVVFDRSRPANGVHLNFAVSGGEKPELLFGLHAFSPLRTMAITARMVVPACPPRLRLAATQLQDIVMIPKPRWSAWL